MKVANDSQRHQAVERMLRHGAGAPSVPATHAACVDGEMLAAWREGALAEADAARVEEHLTDCARCQSMLAAFARTEPIVAVTPGLARRSFSGGGARWEIRWLVPLATAATVAAIWVAVPRRDVPAPSVADSRATQQVQPPPPPAAASPSASAPAPTEAPSQLPDQKSTTPTTQNAQPRRESQMAQEKREAETDLSAAARQRAADRLVQADPLTAPAAPAPAPAPPPPPPQPQLQPQFRQAPPAVAESVAIAPSAALGKVAGVEFASPDGSTRWRVVNGQIERSTTRGKNWETIALPSPAALTAGHAPRASVAWFVGRSGAVFVTDGVRFERIPFPQPLDLASVLAVDERQATVTTVDGRVFGTSDRGITWIQP